MKIESFKTDESLGADIQEEKAVDNLNKKEKLELIEFSKRYSAHYRQEIAQKLRQLRFLQQLKLKEKPKEINELKSSIEQDELSIEELLTQKIDNEKNKIELENILKSLNQEIENLRKELNERKNSLFYKIRERFLGSGLDEEGFEILQKYGRNKDELKNKLKKEDFDFFERIKTKEAELVSLNSLLAEKQQKIESSTGLLENLAVSIEEKYKTINEAEEILESDFEIKEAEKAITDFYKQIGEEKAKLEITKKERNIAEISKENGVLFCHAIPLEMEFGDNFSQNNEVVKTRKIDVEEKIKLILGLEPTISVSTLDKENSKLARNFGVFLKGGQVLSAYAGDVGTLVDNGIYNRKSKYDKSLRKSIIQQNIETNIFNSINHTQNTSSYVEDMAQGWNELVVENPQTAGLFYQKGNKNTIPGDFSRAKNISQSLNLPLYILDGDKIYEADFSRKTGEEIEGLKETTIQEAFDSQKELSTEERKDFIGEMIDKKAFNQKEESIYMFNGYNVGKAYYQFIKRVDAGEKIDISQINDNTPFDDKDVKINLFDCTYVIREMDTKNESWDFHYKKKWEKYGTYYDPNDIGGNGFNAKFARGDMWEPTTPKFIMEGDGISSYVNMAERELERLQEQEEKFKKKSGDIGFIPLRKKSVMSILFGFMEEAQKDQNDDIYNKAKAIIEKFGNLNEYENFTKERVGEDGKFQYLYKDVPIEVRNKIKELN